MKEKRPEAKPRLAIDREVARVIIIDALLDVVEGRGASTTARDRVEAAKFAAELLYLA